MPAAAPTGPAPYRPRRPHAGATRAELAGEFAGMAILMVPLAMEIQGAAGAPGTATGWILSVTFGVVVAAELGSAAHLNPAVTLVFALGTTMRRRFPRLVPVALPAFPWAKAPAYIAAQLAGAITTTLVVRWQYAPVLARVGYGPDTVRAFATLPPPGISLLAAAADQVIGTGVLLFGILILVGWCATTPMCQRFVLPVAVGLYVGLIGISMNMLAAASINPARDLGPRIVAGLTGWGARAWVTPDGAVYWWVPLVAQLVGATVGVAAYVAAAAPRHARATAVVVPDAVAALPAGAGDRTGVPALGSVPHDAR